MDTPVLRCKMRVQSVMQNKDENGETDSEQVTLAAVYGKEGTGNAEWSKWTPCASFSITINNPAAFEQLASGHEYFVDFTPAS